MEGSSDASGSESLRFLLGDVVKMKKALFPFGIRLPGRQGLRSTDKGGIVGQEDKGIILEKYAEDEF